MPQRIEVPGMGVVEFPDGMSDAQIEAAIQRNSAPKAGAGERFAAGLADPVHGGAQLLTKMLPQSIVDAGNRANNWLADKTGLVAKLPQGGVDQQVREREADLRARSPDGIDLARLVGNIASPFNWMLALLAPGAGPTLAGKMAQSAGVGAATSLMSPAATGDDFMAEKAKQAMFGALGGAAVPALSAGIGRIVSPAASSNPQLALLRSEGVRPTIGQALGGFANRAEEKAMSLPVVGDAISAARRRAAGDLNTAVANRALGPLGQALPSGLTGREAVAAVKQAMSDAYDALLPRMSVQIDDVFAGEASSLGRMVRTGAMDPKAKATFDRIMQSDVFGKFSGQNTVTGQTYKQIESDLGTQAARFAASTDADQRLVGDALREAQAMLRRLAERNNPHLADELAKVNAGYANFKRLERAASYVGAEDGVFSPANLQSAVKALDRSKDHGRFARGDAYMQDLSDAAKTVLGNKVPDSGTAGRLFLGGGALLGGGAMSPAIPAALGAGAAAYSSPLQGLLVHLAATRPQAAQPIAGLLQQAAPVMAPAGGLLSLQAFQ